jgi:hypothetical protein
VVPIESNYVLLLNASPTQTQLAKIMAHENAKNVINAYKLTSTKLLQLRVVLFYYLIHHQHIYNQPKEFPMEQKRK